MCAQLTRVNSTDDGFPYCRKYTTGIFSGFDCFSEASEVEPVLPTPIGGYETLDFSSTASRTTATATASASTDGESAGQNSGAGMTVGGASVASISATPFSLTQASGSAGTGGTDSATAGTTSASGNGGSQVARLDMNKIAGSMAVAMVALIMT
jgi:cytoskeletal protein RodZ